MATIKGNVLDCIQREIRGSNNVYYEFYVNFGDGLIKETAGTPVTIGEHEFHICPKGRDDIKAKIKVVE